MCTEKKMNFLILIQKNYSKENTNYMSYHRNILKLYGIRLKKIGDRIFFILYLDQDRKFNRHIFFLQLINNINITLLQEDYTHIYKKIEGFKNQKLYNV